MPMTLSVSSGLNPCLPQAVVGTDGIEDLENEAVSAVHELMPQKEQREARDFLAFACAGRTRTRLAAQLGLPHVARQVGHQSKLDDLILP